MKTKQIIVATLLLGSSLLIAQSGNKPVTVRIKKTEIINGVEKTSDSTFTTTDPSTMKIDGGGVDIHEVKDPKDGSIRKTVIINNEVSNKANADAQVFIFTSDSTIKTDDNTIQTINTSMHKDGKAIVVRKPGTGKTEEEIKNSSKEYNIFIIKRVTVVEVTEDDKELLGKETGSSDNKLNLTKLDFYPNPSNGKFNLSFNLKEKGNTDITILNTEGKKIYSENLNDFTGAYNKEIDISKNPKGVYFVRVEQGPHSQLKKIVLE